MSLFNLQLSEQSLHGPSMLLLDSLPRINYNSSSWYSIFNGKEKQRLNHEIWRAVSDFFQQRYHIENRSHFNRIWKEVAENKWSVKQPLTVGRLRTIDAAFKNLLVYHGPGISLPPPRKGNPTIQKLIHALIHGGPLSTALVKTNLLSALLIKHNPQWLKEFRAELQHELNHLANNPPKNAQEEILWRQFLGNIIAFLPFGYPLQNEIFIIPQLDIDGSCRPVTYQTTIIELTATHSSSPISAIGLLPILDDKASPILSFLGTTFPAGNGFVETIKADFTPNMSVGKNAYLQGKEKINAWLKDKTNVYLVGTSLGGALALHTMLDHHSKITRVDVYNPPGLYSNCWKDKSFDEGCPINIYRQPGDIVSMMGYWPTGNKVEVYNVIPHQSGITEMMPNSHVRIFSGCRKVSFIRSNAALENTHFSRKFLTFLHLYLGPLLIYYPTSFALGCYRIMCAAQRCWNELGHKTRKPLKKSRIQF